MQKPDFTDADAKLARAREHISNIQARIASFLATDFYRLRLETDQREGRIKVLFDSLHQPDKSLNAAIGDAIGNLRSTLDYAAVALVKPITGKPESVGFPFADNVNGFTGEVTKGSLSVCDQRIRDHFINEVQAYDGGKGNTLWILNKLRNIDKHRLLLATVDIAGIRLSFRDANHNVFEDVRYGIVAGQSGTFIDAPINHIEFTNQPTPLIEVRLTEAPYIPEAPALGVLNRFASDVETLLDALKVVV